MRVFCLFMLLLSVCARTGADTVYWNTGKVWEDVKIHAAGIEKEGIVIDLTRNGQRNQWVGATGVVLNPPRPGLAKQLRMIPGLIVEEAPGGGLRDPTTPSLSQAFDSNAIAQAETRMWKAYYGNHPVALGRELVNLLHAQFGLPPRDALRVSGDLAKATLIFQQSRGDYDARVLPDLESAYSRLKMLTGGSWNPKEAARAELDWWIMRRTPGQDSPEQVGRAIARLYTILYGRTNDRIERAGLLRAKAAQVRDRGGKNCNWPEVRRLLQQSYKALSEGITESAPAKSSQ